MYWHDSDIPDLSFESMVIITSINSTNTPVTVGILRILLLKLIVSLNSDGHQFHQYQQQNKQSPLFLTELTEHRKGHNIWHWKSRSWLVTGTKMLHLHLLNSTRHVIFQNYKTVRTYLIGTGCRLKFLLA